MSDYERVLAEDYLAQGFALADLAIAAQRRVGIVLHAAGKLLRTACAH